MNATALQVFKSLYGRHEADPDGLCLTLMLRERDEATERYRWYLQTLGPRRPEPLPDNEALAFNVLR